MIDNYNDFRKELEELKELKQKPSLLLHSCCAPCSTHVLKLLKEVFDITIFYYNPNIYPLEEYNKRYEELLKLITILGSNVKIVYGYYDYNLYLESIKGFENLGEKSKRCYNCYELRLKETFKYAYDNHFDYYTTTLSISPYKNSNWINEIGNRYKSDNCKYLYSNFKKEEGYKKSIVLSKEYELYRQDYCGCEFSIIEHKKMINNKRN